MPSKLLQKTAAVVCAAAALCFWRPADARAAEEPWYFEALGVEAARDAGLSGAGVKIALIDSGVNASHEDLADADITGYNFLGSEPYADVSAYGADLGHGTLVCGILAATAGNGLGTDGLVPDASVLMLRCFSSLGGSANAGSGAKETIRRAVEYAIEADADVLNMSIGGTKQSLQELEPVFRQAADAGILLIASVGNGGGTALYYPAAFDCVTGVGWLTRDGTASASSQHNATVYVAAPGQDMPGPDWRTDDGYRTDSGSSFAAPVVAAMAVMAKQTDRAIGTDGFRALLRQSAKDLGEPGRDGVYGYGAVDIAAFTAALRSPQPIDYRTNGGVLSGAGYDVSYLIGKGDLAVLPDESAIAREGFAFTGWYLDENCTEAADRIPAGSVGSVTLYAGWEESPAAPLSQPEPCPLCGRPHGGRFGGVVAIIHRVLYWFRLLGGTVA